jgi:hypothetical protein
MAWDLINLRDGEVLHRSATRWLGTDNEWRRAWNGPPRYCDCGQRITKYKNPQATHTDCYKCEDKKPWNWERIARGGIS